MDGQRRDRLRELISATNAGPDREGWAPAVCAVCVQVLTGVDAAALTLRTDTRAQEMIGASDQWSTDLEEAQYTLGEGPSVQAFRAGSPVLVTDITTAQVCWPGFAAASQVAGAAAVFAFPLQVGGIRLGTLTLYRRRPGGLTSRHLSDAAVLAELATLALLADTDRAGDDGIHVAVSYGEVNIATGMLAAQLRIPLDDAFVRLRGHAYATNRSVLTVARDVLARTLRLDQRAD